MGNTKLANPAPLGLMGFGMTTILLNLHNVGYFALDGIILAMGIFYGGIAQILLVCWSTKRQHFRFNRIHLLRFFLADAGCDSADAETGSDRCAKCTVPWCLHGSVGRITLFMFFGTLKGARVLQFVFFSLTVLFALLAIGNIAGNAAIIHFAGWIGLICGASAIYLAMGEVLNEQFGRTVLPIGESH